MPQAEQRRIVGHEFVLDSEPESNLMIQRAKESTKKARINKVKKYSKRFDIQHFEVGNFINIKVPREDRTSKENKRLFSRILDESYPHRYKVLTFSETIKLLIPTKELFVVDKTLWTDVIIPNTKSHLHLQLRSFYK
jgi:hypothetical protein